ncbi:hypothetical protein [Ferrimonas sp. SCSIO 43195]|uniref:hypothetical protein n=1 Tax=Ferrimonas sp. SCSIO 43195 TaxID=2822844 RepID=UPI0020765E2B|nr:hypothetical protein [Ferrimonas sp. SCSIO 43195]USD37665.1 hypothetical protein J8Z22_00290 [Ferrimonas sp. SCSIO 43195]
MIRITLLHLSLLSFSAWSVCGDLCQWLDGWFDDYLTPVNYNYAHASLARIHATDQSGLQLAAGALTQLSETWLLDLNADMNWQQQGGQPMTEARINRFQGRLDYRLHHTDNWDFLAGIGTSIAQWRHQEQESFSIDPVVAVQARGNLAERLDLELRYQLGDQFDHSWNVASIGMVFYPVSQVAFNLRGERTDASDNLILETRFLF